MGLFSKKSSSEPSTPVTPVTAQARVTAVRDGDVERAAALMHQFSQAPGSDQAVRAFGVELNRAGGFASPPDILEAVRVGGPGATKWPWLWLAAVAREALARNERLLVAQLALATWFWSTQIAPNLGIADSLDGIVDAPSGEAVTQLYAAGREALSGLPLDTVVMETPIATLLAADVLTRIS